MTGSGPTAGAGSEALSDRVVAYLIDFGLLSAVVLVLWGLSLGVLAGLARGGAELGSSLLVRTLVSFARPIVSTLLWVTIGLVVFCYFTLLDGARDGTLGKRVMDVEVVDSDGHPPSRTQTAIRTGVLMLPYPVMATFAGVLDPVRFVAVVGLMGIWLLVEAAVMVVSDEGTRLGDVAADTVVVPRTDAADPAGDPGDDSTLA